MQRPVATRVGAYLGDLRQRGWLPEAVGDVERKPPVWRSADHEKVPHLRAPPETAGDRFCPTGSALVRKYYEEVVSAPIVPHDSNCLFDHSGNYANFAQGAAG